jgi:Homeodomain-like domain
MSQAKLLQAVEGVIAGLGVRAVVSPNVTGCHLLSGSNKTCKTKPPRAGEASRPGRKVEDRPMRDDANVGTMRPSAREMSPDVTSCHRMSRPGARENAKTNPPRADGDLSLGLRRLAAARLLVRGLGVAQVAAQIGVHRRTIWRWTRDVRFMDEVRRMVRSAQEAA